MNFSMIRSSYFLSKRLIDLNKIEKFWQILTPILDPSFIGFATTGNFILFSLFMLLAIFSHPFSIIILSSLICFIFLDYIFFKNQNKKINISLIFVSITTLFFLFHYLGYVETDNVSWIKQPELKFFTNFYLKSVGKSIEFSKPKIDPNSKTFHGPEKMKNKAYQYLIKEMC